MKKAITIIIVAITMVGALNSFAYAHSGRTDSDGGHWNNSGGYYEYH